jgi:hypothetical protein
MEPLEPPNCPLKKGQQNSEMEPVFSGGWTTDPPGWNPGVHEPMGN